MFFDTALQSKINVPPPADKCIPGHSYNNPSRLLILNQEGSSSQGPAVVISKTFNKGDSRHNHAHIFKDRNMVI